MSLTSADRYDRTVLAWNQLALIDWVAPGAQVLELGASTGYMSHSLREKGCHVVAVEYDRDALRTLAGRADEAHFGDLEDAATLAYLDARRFDVIMLADVLEHLRDPALSLSLCRQWLNPGGSVLISMPNIAYWWIRLNLLRGRWDMSRTGIMDETHLRFFTLRSAERMFESAGFVVRRRKPVWDGMPFDSRFRDGLQPLWPLKQRLNGTLQQRYPALFAYQYLWALQPV